MPSIKTESLEKNQIKLMFTITQEEAWPYLEEAAKRLSTQTQIPGFRPGHAGYEIVKQRVGEMRILEEALEPLVRKSYVTAILSEDLRIDGFGTWVGATVVVWLATLLASLLLPVLVVKRVVDERHR
jgi:FKBP-type peptidyl-prolyl cis-trans isomerase (trigger factor)